MSWATHSLQTLVVPKIDWCVCTIILNDIDQPQSNSNTNLKWMSKSHCHLSVASSQMFLTKIFAPSWDEGNSELMKDIPIRCLGVYFVWWYSEGMILTVVSTVMLLYVKRFLLSHETKWNALSRNLDKSSWSQHPTKGFISSLPFVVTPGTSFGELYQTFKS